MDCGLLLYKLISSPVRVDSWKMELKFDKQHQGTVRGSATLECHPEPRKAPVLPFGGRTIHLNIMTDVQFKL